MLKELLRILVGGSLDSASPGSSGYGQGLGLRIEGLGFGAQIIPHYMSLFRQRSKISDDSSSEVFANGGMSTNFESLKPSRPTLEPKTLNSTQTLLRCSTFLGCIL